MNATPEADLGSHVATALLGHAAAGSDSALLRATLRRLHAERATGNVCLPLSDWSGRDDGDAVFPRVDAWSAALAASGLCGTGGDGAPELPLVLDAVNRLYLRRDFAAERTIASFVRSRSSEPPRIDAAALRANVHAVASTAARQPAADQLLAIAAATRSSFAVITGGPGTGKTTTVATLLAVLQRIDPDLRVALAAPTGKAAARLQEAMQQRAAEDPTLRDVAARCRPTTLHRLLGYLPVEDTFRVTARNPLRHDLVVVDEASMADPVLLAAVCAAMPTHGRLLLVGDRDQLAAVAAGQVLGDVCRAAQPEHGPGKALAAYANAAFGVDSPVRAGAPAIADCVVQLQRGHRFTADSGIGAFAQALGQRDAAAALTALRSGGADLQWQQDPAAALQQFAAALLRAATPGGDDAAARVGGSRILTATRHGAGGSIAWNRRVEALLATHGVRVEDPHYPGRPVLVTANDYQNHVFNGDLGVMVRGANDEPLVAFPRGDGTVRRLPPQRLPAHETAWAMTVHKAQGSEFDDVLLVMPDQAGPSWQAPLLYTGITRARRRALLLANETLLAPALAHWPARSSGLADALRD